MLKVTALVACAAQGVTESAAAMVKDFYARLKALVNERLGSRPGVEVMLAKHEQSPQTWQAPLMAELAEASVDRDHDLIAAAKALLDLVGEAGGGPKYSVDARGSQGMQVGHHNRQNNVFNAPDSPHRPPDCWGRDCR